MNWAQKLDTIFVLMYIRTLNYQIAIVVNFNYLCNLFFLGLETKHYLKSEALILVEIVGRRFELLTCEISFDHWITLLYFRFCWFVGKFVHSIIHIFILLLQIIYFHVDRVPQHLKNMLVVCTKQLRWG